jgi:hypothetical protein
MVQASSKAEQSLTSPAMANQPTSEVSCVALLEQMSASPFQALLRLSLRYWVSFDFGADSSRQQ